MSGPGTFWRPRSGCGHGCLPPPRSVPAAGVPRRAVRLAGVLAMLAVGGALLLWLPVSPRRWRPTVGTWWARGLLRALGVRLRLVGARPRTAALLAVNHVSWLDTLAILAVSPARMLAKVEVRRWPVVGALARAGGTIFIDRERPRTLPDTVAAVGAVLRCGGQVAVFPQATTTCGTTGLTLAGGAASGGGRCSAGTASVMPFRPALFQAALDAGVPVVPVGLTYHLVGAAGPAADDPVPTSVAAFIGDEALWPSVRRVLGLRGLAVTVEVAAPVPPQRAPHRRTLARLSDRVGRPDRADLDLVG
ncbi:lysophospholipid acyltransferase family protein [Solwaraspora sp. WMMA2056]|uniref:lysophospholipid acyltransferase family protein n=1 Tax=Solwaraspora sp. WMMA2056 TaxID=3015161 RepID=UPI00259B3939|nr:lysophospholipid acyltransferase family protein [Solwaraspora sp. WMMA2056]WJK40383.1 lysophospholipid acyltransferase family protein [Solwaraspora sp. WMMA2056]